MFSWNNIDMITIINLTDPERTSNFEDGDFLEYRYPNGTIVRKHWLAPVEIPLEEIIENERKWRDEELLSTDWVVPVTDHPKHADYLAYRQELRDYPSQPDFPNGTRPEKP